MNKKIFKKKESKEERTLVEVKESEKEIELTDDELESISGGIAPILGGKPPKP